MMTLRLILLMVIVAVTGWCPGCALEVSNDQGQDSGLPDGEVGGDPGDSGNGYDDSGPGYDDAGAEYDDGGIGDDANVDPGDDGGDAGTDEVVCEDECVQGLTQCGDGGLETCGDYDDDTCLEWGGLTGCGAGLVCELGECVVDCGPQCSGGARRCATGGAEGIESCGDYAGDSCLEWGGLQTCDANLVCDPVALQCLRPYPPGPYDTVVGTVLDNLCLEECRCDGSVAKGALFCMRELLDNKATLISVHSGWCTACRTQTTDAEQLYQAYQAQGLGMVFVFYEDDLERSSRQAVLDYGCWEKGYYGLTFMLAIDPGLQVMLPYFYDGSIPLNIIVDDEMVIRYMLEGYDAASLEATIQLLMAE